MLLWQQMKQDCVVAINTGQWAGWSGQRVSAGPKDFYLLHNDQTDSGAHPASYKRGTESLSLGKSSKNVNLTIYLHLVPLLRMCGATPLLSLYAFVEWTGTTLLLMEAGYPTYVRLTFLG